jgi:phage-related protein
VATQAVFYRDEKGREPVGEFRSRLTVADRSAVDRQIRDLNGLADNDPPPPFPSTSQIDGPLRELRCRGSGGAYRIFYRRSGNLLVLLHVITKSNRRTPRRDIELAQRRWDDFKERMDAPDRRGPRPIGRDAP